MDSADYPSTLSHLLLTLLRDITAFQRLVEPPKWDVAAYNEWDDKRTEIMDRKANLVLEIQDELADPLG